MTAVFLIASATILFVFLAAMAFGFSQLGDCFPERAAEARCAAGKATAGRTAVIFVAAIYAAVLYFIVRKPKAR